MTPQPIRGTRRITQLVQVASLVCLSMFLPTTALASRVSKLIGELPLA